jgi:hypothetical protein
MTEDARMGSTSRQDFEKEVIRRAATDADFRHRLLADPRATLEATYAMELPHGIELQVLEETPSKFYLVLPVVANELTDEQLAGVAGGTGMPALQDRALFDKLDILSASAVQFNKKF